MASKRQRVFILAVTIVFFITSVGTSAAILYSIVTDDNEPAVSEQTQDTAKTDTQPTSQEDSLKGTKLEDYTPVKDVKELEKIDLAVGTGQEVKTGDTITAHYTGALAADGVIFESSLDTGQPVTFPLSGVIVGWQEGVPGMKEGGKRRLIIPASKAYGDQPPAGIPVNADLVFDIELVSIGEPQN